ncbi:MAG: FAD-dependent oxidoreductase [Deltaproteobacteria bacterium]
MKYLQSKKLMLVLTMLCIVCLLMFGVNVIKNNTLLQGSAHNNWQKASDTYDIIVVGGEPEGISAAVSAARSGGKVLLVSYENGLGGLMTYGMLNSIDMNRNAARQLVTRGVFLDFYNGVGGDSFDVKKAKEVFEKMVKRQKNMIYISGTKFISPIMDKNTIKGIRLEKDGTQKEFFAKRIIDATPDADVAASAGAPYSLGQEDVGLKDTYMCATLVFRVKNVDWKQLGDDIRKNLKTKKIKDEGINSKSAWGFGEIRKEYKPLHSNMKIRGLNIGKQNDGSILINALQIVNINMLDEASRKKAIEEGKKEAENITLFLKKKIPAFENASFAGAADNLYIRETRHIKGEYTLKIQDVLNNRNFEDKIAVASYPVDIQASSIEDMGNVICTPDQYSIPLRCLVPLNIENIFVAGRSASYTSTAAGSARVIPVGMVTGQAAGVAAVYSIKNDISPRKAAKSIAAVKKIQETLIKQGAYLPDFNSPNSNASHWAFPDIEKLSEFAAIGGGYQNNYRFSDKIRNNEFIGIINNVVKKQAPAKFDQELCKKLFEICPGEYITKDDAAQMILYIYDKKVYNKNIAWKTANEKKLLSPEFVKRLKGEQLVLREEAFNEVVYFIQKISGKKY